MENSATLHEPRERLSAATVEMHRAIASLMEELEAIDWYGQRVDASDDAALRAVLDHNRKEEIEHAAMTLEWIRRRDPAFDRMLRTYLFTEGDIVEKEGVAEGGGDAASGDGAGPPASGSLGIGSLRGAVRGEAGG